MYVPKDRRDPTPKRAHDALLTQLRNHLGNRVLRNLFEMLARGEDPTDESGLVRIAGGEEPDAIAGDPTVYTEVIEPLEEEINTIEGIKTLTSVSGEQTSIITAEVI